MITNIPCQIDEIDKKIADLLVADGSLSCAQIAAQIPDISERAVRYRRDRLIKQGIISINAVAKARALGYSVNADVFIVVEPGKVLEVAHRLAECEQVTYVACAMGESDVSIQVVARNNEELHRFVVETVGRVPGVTKTTTMIVPMILKDVYQWQIPKSVCQPAGGES